MQIRINNHSVYSYFVHFVTLINRIGSSHTISLLLITSFGRTQHSFRELYIIYVLYSTIFYHFSSLFFSPIKLIHFDRSMCKIERDCAMGRGKESGMNPLFRFFRIINIFRVNNSFPFRIFAFENNLFICQIENT